MEEEILQGGGSSEISLPECHLERVEFELLGKQGKHIRQIKARATSEKGEIPGENREKKRERE